MAVAAYERERGRLDILLAEKARLLATVSAADASWRERVEAWAGSARDLRGLLERLALHRRAEGRAPTVWPLWPRHPARRGPVACRRTAVDGAGRVVHPIDRGAQGQLPAPVIGSVVQGFGRRDGRGQITKGVAIRSRPARQWCAV